MATRVLQVSDVHVTSGQHPEGSPDPEERFDAVLAAAVERFGRPDLVVASGDLVDDGSLAATRLLADRLQSLGVPVLAVPGNHDDPAVVAECFGTATAAEIGGWRVLAVDTSRPQQIHGTVDAGALRERLDAVDPRPTLVALHHPPASPSTHEWFRLDGADELVAVLGERPHVRAVLSGHLHLPFDLDLAGVRVLGAPSTWVGISHDGDRFVVGGSDTAGARWLALHDDGSFTTELLRA